MLKKSIITAFLFTILVSGCSTVHFPGVYRIDIPQGNFVTDDMVAQLKVGMTPEQVEYVLGPPMLVDPFTKGTWFYLMTYRPGQGKEIDQQVVVYFTNGRYDHYEGKVVPNLQDKTKGQKDRELMEKKRQKSKQLNVSTRS